MHTTTRRHRAFTTAALAAGAFALAPAHARDAEETPKVDFSLRGGATFDLSADLDDSPGDVSVARVRSGLETGFRIDDLSRLALTFDTEFSFYDFSGATGLIPGTDSPLDNTYDYRIGARYSRSLDDDWGIFLGGDVRFAGEHGANPGDALTGGGYGGFTVEIDKRLTVGMGLSVRSRLEDSVRIYPFPILDFRMTDEWRLSTDGPGARLSFTPNPPITFYIAGRWESREYRLDKDSALPKGVARDERVPLVAGITWRPGPNLTIDGFAGVAVWNELEFLDSSGARVAKTDIDPHLTFGAHLTLRF